jgi:hypothetical protein
MEAGRTDQKMTVAAGHASINGGHSGVTAAIRPGFGRPRRALTPGQTTNAMSCLSMDAWPGSCSLAEATPTNRI